MHHLNLEVRVEEGVKWKYLMHVCLTSKARFPLPELTARVDG